MNGSSRCLINIRIRLIQGHSYMDKFIWKEDRKKNDDISA